MSDDSAFIRLPAPTRDKAMDWSLVLASQDIPHLIASPEESAGWSLQVSETDARRAADAIQQFEAENEARPWQQHYFGGKILFDWTALIWAAALVAIHALAERHPFVPEAGMMRGAEVSHGEWWRLVTATQLHADWGHLASNLSIGFVLLGLVLGRWGTATGMLVALLAGVGGNVGNWLLQPGQRSLGASTVVMGCIGLLALNPPAATAAPRRVWSGIFGGIAGAAMLFMLSGLDPRSDVLAHAGGFFSGLGLAALLRACPQLTRARGANIIATILLAALMLAAWLSALSTAPSVR